MRPDLIGERCKWCNVDCTVVAWWQNSAATVVNDHGHVLIVSIADLQFPPRTEQPDELREAAEALLTLLTLDDIAGRLSGVEMDTRMAIVRLQEAMQ